MAIHACDHLGVWLNTLADLREQGKTLELADNPDTRHLGFSEGGTTHLVPHLKVKCMDAWWKDDEERDAVLARLRITSLRLNQLLRSPSTREELINIEIPQEAL